jgi:hypothetical protein
MIEEKDVLSEPDQITPSESKFTKQHSMPYIMNPVRNETAPLPRIKKATTFVDRPVYIPSAKKSVVVPSAPSRIDE